MRYFIIFLIGVVFGMFLAVKLKAEFKNAPEQTPVIYEDVDFSGPTIDPFDRPQPVLDPVFDMKG